MAQLTLSLTGYSSEDFPSRTTRSNLLQKKDEMRLIWPEIAWDLSLWRRPECQTLSKTVDISSATARVALLKAPAILSDTTMKRSVVDQQDLKPCEKLEKMPYFSRWSTSSLLFASVLETLLATERRLTGW